MAATLTVLTPALRAEAVTARSLQIGGWPSVELGIVSPPAIFGDDPVAGRLLCPSLTRLDLHDGKTEPFVLRSVSASEDRKEWQLSLRSGVTWWNGEQVKGGDLAEFVSRTLKAMQDEPRKLGATVSGVPNFQVKAGSDGVSVFWQTPPKFGPYVFSGLPFWRQTKVPDSGRAWECAGRYAIEASVRGQDVLQLRPTRSSGGAKWNLVLAEKAQLSGDALSFSMADRHELLPPEARGEVKTCRDRIDLPIVSAIVWNSHSPAVTDPELRKILTQLTPRGEILRTGASGLGDLLPGLVPRNHPGYAGELKVRPFSLEESASTLDRLGFRRLSPEKPRMNKDGNPLKLTLATSTTSAGFVEKIVADSFSAVGINTKVEPSDQPQDTFDGRFVAWQLPWPSMDLSRDLLFDGGGAWHRWLPKDPGLEQQLIEYSRTLSNGRPDYAILKRIQVRFFQLEPVTVLMQHRACIRVNPPFVARGTLDPRDPDWFWRIVQ